MNCLGIVGIGSIGRRHLRLVKEIRPDIHVVAVRSGYGGSVPEETLIAKTVTSVEEAVITGIEAAIIATPAHLRVSQIRPLVAAHIPVLVEKPISMTAHEADELVSLFQRSRLAGLVGYNLRYSTGLQHFAKFLSNDSIGSLLHVTVDCGSYLPDWRPGRDYRYTPSANAELGGGVLRELSHELDYASWLFGPFRSISSTIRRSGMLSTDVEDMVSLQLESAQGHPVVVHLDFCRRHPHRSCTVVGTHGRIIWDGINQTVEAWDASNTRIKRLFAEERDVMYRRQLHHFLRVVEDAESPQIPLTAGAQVMRLIQAAWKADETGCRVSL